MIPVLGKDETRDVIFLLNPYGGAIVEIFQYVSKKPVPVPNGTDLSYNGFLFYGLKVRNIPQTLEKIQSHGGIILSGSDDFTPMKNGGWKTAAFRDPDGITGILIEYPESNVGYGKGNSRIGGIEYTAVGVSNLEKSIDFYSNILGYNDVVYTHEGKSPEWEALFGAGKSVKRALLKKSDSAQGVFKHFLRGGMIELVQVGSGRKKHNFDGRKWGDIGFMELCFDVTDIDSTLDDITGKNVSITVPKHSQEMGMNTAATFAYIRDPDGSMLEFADIKSLPVPYFLIRMLVNPPLVGMARKLKLLK
jgi:catechol 2,3-dioxygenase-like lactoylglutathione lyase family enzyme